MTSEKHSPSREKAMISKTHIGIDIRTDGEKYRLLAKPQSSFGVFKKRKRNKNQ